MISRPIVVWDWNGTIVDDAFIFVDIMNDYLSLYGLPEITPEDYKNNFCFPVNNYYKRLGFKLSEKEFKKLSVNFIQKYKKVMFFPSLKKDILSVLKYLKKLHYKQFVVSAQEQGLLRQSVDYYGLTGYFGGSFGLNNNLAVSKKSVAKKHIFPYLKKNQGALFIGDTIHDYEVAKSLGADCCLVSWGHNSKNKLKKTKQPVVDSVDDLLFFLKNL